MQVGTGEVVSAKAVGEVRLSFNNNCFIALNNVYFIPGFKRNLISVSKLLEFNYSFSFYNKSVIISRNGLDICSGMQENNLYVLRPLMHKPLLKTKMFQVEK